MAQSLPKDDLVPFKELLMACSVQVDALAQGSGLLAAKGFIRSQLF